jgi:CubicO group peptidase (beta-lactamase class C family)
MPLMFNCGTAFAAPARHAPIDGYWLGTLGAAQHPLRIQLSVSSDAKGQASCVTDSPDQGAYGAACANATLAGGELAFDIPAVNSRWKGTLSADAAHLTGTWHQGIDQPLNFERQATPLSPPPPVARRFDPALPPVTVADLPAVLARDLDAALQHGALAPETSAGLTIGVLRNGRLRVVAFGTAKADSIFEIGSISKTFTGLLLAQLTTQGKLHLDEPVRELLPAGTVAPPTGAEITLLDLVTQHSGLPRLPDNFAPSDQGNPYKDYHAADLYAYLGQHGVGRSVSPPFLYSNLGVGLLGQALAERSGLPYAQMLAALVTQPLGLHDTVITLTPAQRERFIAGHSADHKTTHEWDLDALAGAGAIRSTAGDMLRYLEANLHPQPPVARAKTDAAARSLPAAMALSHELRNEAGPAMRIAFAWLYDTETGNYWHNGATGGDSSYTFFNPKGDYAAVVLFNTSPGPRGSFADLVGQHVSQRLAGQPAISLAPALPPGQ